MTKTSNKRRVIQLGQEDDDLEAIEKNSVF